MANERQGNIPGVYGAATWTLVAPPERATGGGPWAAAGETGGDLGGLSDVAGDCRELLCAAAGLTGGRGLEAAGELPGICPGLPGPLGTGVGSGGAGAKFAAATACTATKLVLLNSFFSKR